MKIVELLLVWLLESKFISNGPRCEKTRLCCIQTTKVQTSLHGCTVWSAPNPLLFAIWKFHLPGKNELDLFLAHCVLRTVHRPACPALDMASLCSSWQMWLRRIHPQTQGMPATKVISYKEHFACWVSLHMFLLSAGFFPKSTFLKNSFRSTIRVWKSLDAE